MTEVEHYNNGNIKKIEVKNEKGFLHNDNGPAYQVWYKNGQEWYRIYYLNGILHNENGPAVQSWDSDGQELVRSYYLNGNRHNDNGPAYVRWHSNGQYFHREYWINGNPLTEEEFYKLDNKGFSMRTFSIQIDYKTYVASKSFSTNLSNDYNKDDIVSEAVNQGVISPDDMEYVIGFVELDQ